MKFILPSFTVIFVLTLNLTIQAALIRVSQESAPGVGDFENNILGTVESYIPPSGSNLDLAEIYHYGTPISWSYNGQENGAPDTIEKGMMNFFYEDSEGNLGFYQVIGNPGGSNEIGGTAQVYWKLEGDTAVYYVIDDGGDTLYAFNADTQLVETTLDNVEDVYNEGYDSYTLHQTADSTIFASKQRLVSSGTDGYGIGYIEGDWSLTGHINEFDLFENWQIMSADSNNISLSTDLNRNVRYEIIQVPEPSTGLMFVLSTLTFAHRRRTNC